jgi:hypothetical protein
MRIRPGLCRAETADAKENNLFHCPSTATQISRSAYN